MNPKEFFNAVRKMREYQKQYFKTRSPLALKEAKNQERTIDNEIERVQKIIQSKEHPGLFKNE